MRCQAAVAKLPYVFWLLGILHWLYNWTRVTRNADDAMANLAQFIKAADRLQAQCEEQRWQYYQQQCV